MQLVVETAQTDERALLVQKHLTPLTKKLVAKIQKYSVSIQHTTTFPYSYRDISYMFIEKEEFAEKELKRIFETETTKTLILTEHQKIFDEFDALIRKNALRHVKVVRVLLDDTDDETIEKLLWFMLSDSEEASLSLVRTLQPREPDAPQPEKQPFTITRKRMFLAIAFFLIAIHTLFLAPLAVSGFLIYKAGRAAADQNFPTAQSYTNAAKPAMTLTEATYALARPGLQFLFLSLIPENLINTEKNALIFIDTSITAAHNAREIFSLFLNTKKDPGDIDETRSRIRDFKEQVAILESTSQKLYDGLDYTFKPVQDARERFAVISGYLQTSTKLAEHLDSLLADNARKDYVIFFYNNMEIRPGGGFIGSFAHVTLEDYTLESFTVYDVYDADGQLKTHVRPPAPIRTHLDQPHWFLRDSNFSPDFEQNVRTAEFFLDEELGLNGFDGAVAITTTALTYILDAFGEVYVPDFKETITADNFYLKAQARSEIDFFPGSSQKKSFLSTVGRTLMLKLEDASPAQLGIAIKRALDEKHIVIHTKDPLVQRDIDSLGWGGKIVNPQCVARASNCIINHILPVDANLGVNKANYFVSKLAKLKSVMHQNGEIDNELSFSYTNNSVPDVFPGGTYKNYFQLYLPHDASIQQLQVNGKVIRNYDTSKTGTHRIIGTFVEIPPGETVIVTAEYRMKDVVRKGDNAYQIVLQKQIGAFNNEFSLEIQLPPGATITSQNFKSVAKNNTVFYNSTLSTNKIFVIEFIKE